MRTAIVPAQVTTVEDKITGNLSVIQLLLIILPVLVGGILFVALPPFFSYAVYKIVAIVCLIALCASLAIRIKGKIVLHWLIILLRFNLRPRYYVFDVNDTYLKDECLAQPQEPELEVRQTRLVTKDILPTISTADLVKVKDLLSNPATRPSFEISKKGIVSVRITEVK